jgi:hypothetical protein
MKTPALLILLLAASHPRAGATEETAAAPATLQGQPELVGNLGRTRALQFAGNHSFPTDMLRKSLAKDLEFVLASHSAERLEAFLPLVAERLRLGYLTCGFPAAKVRVTHQPGDDDEGTLVVTIEEGPRYRQGEIHITGGEGIDPRRLAEALGSTPEDGGTSSQVAAIRAAMAPQAAELPAALAPAAGAPAADLTQTLPGLEFLTAGNSSTSQEADWLPGEPAEFKDGNQQPLEAGVRFRLAEQGRPLARFTTSHVLRPGGTADLRIDIANAGPEARVGTVQVSGARRNTEAEIRRAAGLEEGEAVLPRQLDEAMLALWRSGRFLPFEIDMHPRGGNSPEIDFHIRVCELEKVPPLATPATADQQCVLQFIDWINRGMDGDELLVELTEPGAGTMRAGWSHRDGLFLSALTDETRHGLSLSQSANGISLVVRDRGDALPARIDLPLGGFRAWCHVLAQNTPQPMSISLGVGFSSLGAKSEMFQSLNLLITPAYVFLKEGEITRDGDTVVVKDLLRLDAATGRLTGIRGGSARVGPGGVRELQEALDREVHALKTGVSALDWVEAISKLVAIDEIAEGVPDSVHKALADARKIAPLLDLVGGSGVLAPLLDLLRGHAADPKLDEDEFFIPTDPATLQRGGMLALMIGAGGLGIAEEILPDIEWASTFSRELLFIAGGQTRHTRKVMNDLLGDPSIGPFSCLVCARFLDTLDPATARRFLVKARDQASAEAFRHDWRMFLGSRTALGESLDRAVASVAAFGPEKEAEAAALLPAPLASWLHGFLEALRRHPADQPLAEWIAPAMDRLWNDHLGASLRRSLEGKIPPPADPEEVAATVDGLAVPRVFVRLLQDQNRAALRDFPLPTADEARPWTRDSVLAAAVRATLAIEEMRRTARRFPDEEIQKSLDGAFPELAGKDDTDWLRETGMNRQQLRHVALTFASAQVLQQQFEAEVGKAEEQGLRDHFKRHARLFRGKFSSDLVFIKPVNLSPKEQTRCHRLASAIGRLPGTGLPVMAVKMVADEDPEAGCAIYSQAGTTADSLQPLVLRALEGLADGEVSGSMELGTGIAVVVLRSRKEDPAIEFGQVEEIVTAHLKKQQADTIANRWFAAREADAEIRIIGPADGPAESSAFDDLLAERPDSRLGLLGDFWVTLNAGDQAATEAAFERLLGAEWKDAGKLVILVEPLANQKRRDLALRCLQKATAANPAMTRRYMDALVDQHAGHGCELGTWLKAQRDGLPKGDGEHR